MTFKCGCLMFFLSTFLKKEKREIVLNGKLYLICYAHFKCFIKSLLKSLLTMRKYWSYIFQFSLSFLLFSLTVFSVAVRIRWQNLTFKAKEILQHWILWIKNSGLHNQATWKHSCRDGVGHIKYLFMKLSLEFCFFF